MRPAHTASQFSELSATLLCTPQHRHSFTQLSLTLSHTHTHSVMVEWGGRAYRRASEVPRERWWWPHHCGPWCDSTYQRGKPMDFFIPLPSHHTPLSTCYKTTVLYTVVKMSRVRARWSARFQFVVSFRTIPRHFPPLDSLRKSYLKRVNYTV